MKRLVLLGGGHAHVNVLTDPTRQPLADWDVYLVTSYRRQIYSGMLPRWIAGHYKIDACAIKLDDLASTGAVAFHQTSGLGLDLERNALRCADDSGLRFDELSIDTGPTPALLGLPGSVEHAPLCGPSSVLVVGPDARVAPRDTVVFNQPVRAGRSMPIILGLPAASEEAAGVSGDRGSQLTRALSRGDVRSIAHPGPR